MERLKGLVVDDALKAGTHIGPVVDQSQLDQDLKYIAIAKEEGGKLAWGGERLNRETPGFYLQPALFTEIQQEHQQRLQQLEWDLAHTYLERMKALVLSEQQRTLEQVLPRRYALATVDLQPLAVEYIVRSTGYAGKELH